MNYGGEIMKIVATVRTFNESKHIRRWCESYSQFADILLVADGGSTDNTIKIASQYPKVQIRNYPVTVTLRDGTKRNPDGPHIQFLVDWATEIGGDWIVHQDCDQRPNKFLKRDARIIMEDMKEDFFQVTQIFLWGKDMYFPKMSDFGNGWAQGLWAWRLSSKLKILNRMPHYEFSLDGHTSLNVDRSGRNLNIQPPYCFLHYGWQTNEETVEHVEYYRRTGLIDGMKHPLEDGGRLAPLEDWMIE
jgi:hypothetical protein